MALAKYVLILGSACLAACPPPAATLDGGLAPPADAGPDAGGATTAAASPFALYGAYEYQVDPGAPPATRAQVQQYLLDLGVPWVREMYKNAADVPAGIHITARCGSEANFRPGETSASATQAYEEALRLVIREQRARVQVWEVDTEPNGFAPPKAWKGAEAGYAEHLRRTAAVIKSECPTCVVSFGGLAGWYVGDYAANLDFLDKALAAGAGDHIDAFEFKAHVYKASQYKELRSKYQAYQEVFARHGIDLDQLPVSVETAAYVGAPCMNPGADHCAPYAEPMQLPLQDERDQAVALVKTYVYGLASHIDRIMWDNLIDHHLFSGWSANIFNMYGLLQNPNNGGSLVPRLSYFTYQKMVATLEGSDWSSLQVVREDGGVYLYRVLKQGRPVWIAWSDLGGTTTLQVSLTGVTASQVVATEATPLSTYATGAAIADGASAFATRRLDVTRGGVTVELGSAPIYLSVP